MVPEIKAVLFDKDGVLVDFHRTWTPAISSFVENYAGGDSQKAGRLMEIAGFDVQTGMFREGSIWAAGNTRDLVQAWLPGETEDIHAELAHAVDRHCLGIEPVPLLGLDDLQSVFSQLAAKGLRLGVVTNDGEASARRTMELFGISRYLDLVVGYNSVANPKPAPDPVLLFCNRQGLKPASIAVVGDNSHDMEMARAAGAGLAVAVLSGNSTRETIGRMADVVIDDIRSLAGVLDLNQPGAADVLQRNN